MNPGGVRIGTPAMTSRGLKEADFERVADFLHEVAQVRELITLVSFLSAVTCCCVVCGCLCDSLREVARGRAVSTLFLVRSSSTPSCSAWVQVQPRKAMCEQIAVTALMLPGGNNRNLCKQSAQRICIAPQKHTQSMAHAKCAYQVGVSTLVQSSSQVCLEVQATSGKLLKDFTKALDSNPKFADIRARVEAFSSSFPMPGFELP